MLLMISIPFIIINVICKAFCALFTLELVVLNRLIEVKQFINHLFLQIRRRNDTFIGSLHKTELNRFKFYHLKSDGKINCITNKTQK